jgi:1-deoxy-D-xylulose-5-phosphate reductoisomerase
MVEYHDGAIIAQMGVPDMRLPIALALSYPERWPLLDFSNSSFAPLAFDKGLTFAKPNREVFRCLALAEAAGKEGGSAPIVLNAAGEVAVEAFLKGAIGFLTIGELVEETLIRSKRELISTVHDALEEDRKGRVLARELLAKL